MGTYLLGGLVLRDFALALFVGLTVGAYSSIFVATPVLAWLKEREPRYRALRARAEADLATPPRAASRSAAAAASRRPSPRRSPPLDEIDDVDGRTADDVEDVPASCGRRPRRLRRASTRVADRARASAPPPSRGAVEPAPATAATARSADKPRFAPGQARTSVGAPVDCAGPMSTTEPRVEIRTDRRSVLPWRRHHTVDVEVAPLVTAYRERHRRTDTGMIEQAFELARVAHAEQVRRSGEPYITHPLGVALILADLGLDDVTIAAALLHDAVEDTSVTVEQIEIELGLEVAAIVDGVTKLDRLQFDSKEAQQAATLRKMLVAMAKDIRVLLIKLADRLHNMRTIASLPEFKQRRIAQETLDIYAPLAHRLGIADVKWQLEDTAFATLYPQRYAEIEQMVAVQAPERIDLLETRAHRTARASRGVAHRGRRARP